MKLFNDRNKPRVSNKRSFINNPYLFLATCFTYNYTQYQAISVMICIQLYTLCQHVFVWQMQYYYGETCWHLSVRVGEHSGVSPLTGNMSKSEESTALKCICFFVIILYPLMTLKFWQPVTQISMLKSNKSFDIM